MADRQQFHGNPYPGQAGPPFPPYGAAPSAGGKALACVSGALFVAVGLLTGFIGYTYLDMHIAAMRTAGVGAAFAIPMGDNEGFATAASLGVCALAVVLGVLVVLRVGAARWSLVALGAVLTVHYAIAVVTALMREDSSEHASMTVVCLVAWAIATLLVALPPTGRAMRGRARPGSAAGSRPA